MLSRGKAGPKLGDHPASLGLVCFHSMGISYVALKAKRDRLPASSYTSAVLTLEQKAGNSREQRQPGTGTSLALYHPSGG